MITVDINKTAVNAISNNFRVVATAITYMRRVYTR
ncbi:hypothetical protein CK203_042563 [Vitis vinifera]|uniref:Uncharacterized protein n=1 Tax=Vitis vinifera TaxID=29760 RepID=A0A438I7Y9_VITVI|nr:hypothetical protein CK203_042563 [Vitis vinifera]